MKLAYTTALATVLMGSAAVADDIVVQNSWVSGSEAAGKQVVIDALAEKGVTWVDASIAGYENDDAAFISRLQAGDPPAAKFYIAGRNAADLIEQGLMQPVTAAVTAEDEAALPELIKNAMGGFVGDGEYYYSPISVHGESWFFYSIPLAEQLGYSEMPTTWDGFFEMLDAAKEAGILPLAFSGQSWQTNKVFNQIAVSMLGAEKYNDMLQNGNEEIVMSPEFLEAVAIFDRLHDYVGEGISGINWNDATAQVIRDEALLQFQGDWAKGEFIAAGEEIGTDYGCAITPGIQDMMIVVDAFTFPKVDQGDAEQLALAETLLNPEVQKGFTTLKGSFPARTDVDMSSYDVCAQLANDKMKSNEIAADMAIVSTRIVQGQLADLINEFWAAPYGHEDFQEEFLDALTY
ncbi:ABC transporter substrate-binding protein [Pseudooceanicola sp. 200-1SW]|uniref:ABC transporter substrate-binding protein n=1 Tax=Pseudooceanicola sp. 200-1SW TaxID=3425949 RepID=UPI003D7FB381